MPAASRLSRFSALRSDLEILNANGGSPITPRIPSQTYSLVLRRERYAHARLAPPVNRFSLVCHSHASLAGIARASQSEYGRNRNVPALGAGGVTPESRRHDREALFPQDLFARFDPAISFHDVTFTHGVQSIVRVGGQLATIDEEVIESFRSRVDEHGLIPLARRPERGDCITIQSGPFADLVGVVERSLPAQERVIVLLTSVASAVRIELPADHLRRCDVGCAS